MAYNNKLAGRVRAYLVRLRAVVEQPMMGGLIFMVSGKMCVGIIKDDLMVRIDPERSEELLARPGCRPMDFGRRSSKGFVFVSSSVLLEPADLTFWLEEGVSFNSKARSSRRR